MSLSRSLRFGVRAFGPVVIFLFVCAPGARALDPERATTQYAMRVWQTEQGLPHNSITALAQTPDGYLWCGTENGLTRFDGSSFALFDRLNTPAIRNDTVHVLLTDRKGRLWIGTGGGGLLRLEDGAFTRFSVNDGLVGDTVQSLAEDKAGALWIGTTSGLSHFVDGHFTNYTAEDGLPSNYCRAICTDPAGHLWVGTGKGLCCFRPDRIETFTMRDGLPDNNIQTLRAGSDGALWVGTNGRGLSRWKDGRFTNFGTAQGLSNGFIRAMHEDRDGNLWVGTDEGVSRWRDGTLTGQFPRGSVAGRSIFGLHEDPAGNLWMGTTDGLLRVGNGRCVTTTTTEGLSGDLVWAVHEDRRGNLWAGTTGGLSVRRNGKWTVLTMKDGLPSDTVLSIAEEADGTMWFGTAAGLTRLLDGKFKTFTTANGLVDNTIAAVFPDRRGNLWVGSKGGGVTRYRDGKFTPVPIRAGRSDVIARVFHEDARGALWIGTNGSGVCVLRGDEIVRYTTKEGLSSDLVLSIYESPDGAIWIGTHGGGLNRLHNGQWTYFNSSLGLPDDIIYQILDDGPYLWMSSVKGIFRVRKDELTDGTRPIHPLLLGKNDGMQILDCSGGSQPAGCRSREGVLWFPTGRGLVAIEPGGVQTNTTPPPVYVERVVADGAFLDAPGALTVAPGRGQLEFHFTAIELDTPERVRFRYQLEGFDKDWVDAGNRRAAYYTNLPPGRYRFRVTACNGDGIWRETPLEIELVLKPHFYQTGLFYGLCALAVGLTGVGGHLFRTRQLRAREEYLARCVEDRTRQLQEEVTEHARTGEQLRQSQKLEAIGQLAGGVAHDFNNLLTVINGCADLLLDGSGWDAQEKSMILDILAAGRRAEGLTHQLLAFSRRQVLEPKVLDPNAVVIDTERMLARMIGEDITVTVSLAPDLFRVKADPVQFQQVLVNLSVNARDAMPRGGRFTIATRNVALDADYTRTHPDIAPGEYVLLEVSDTGCGMTPDVKARVFEPFFTTKGPGKGTGLGLATVYGIVRQSGGHVTVESESEVGTVFKIYFPRADGEPVRTAQPLGLGSVARGAETLLLVEDEPTVRAVARHVLLACGYHVLEAEDGLDGLRVARSHAGRIDLLVSDVVMPNLGGRQLAEQLQQERPGLRVLFVSGYTDDVVLRHGVLEAEVAFLQKPYPPAVLAAKVRAVLDGTSEEVSASPELTGAES
ncbi:response regulator [Gemmata sp. G18]|uniref:histidine kinase n=1 Tax=Gemmata palustris TaxID=2822762 RepID=A0ABS5BP91_9BACT|nr:hybrid sensor histidine kinase/response regulator [Gemmata palustris]MBP3955540.1 response regulator [Gemmata palustris]